MLHARHPLWGGNIVRKSLIMETALADTLSAFAQGKCKSEAKAFPDPGSLSISVTASMKLRASHPFMMTS